MRPRIEYILFSNVKLTTPSKIIALTFGHVTLEAKKYIEEIQTIVILCTRNTYDISTTHTPGRREGELNKKRIFISPGPAIRGPQYYLKVGVEVAISISWKGINCYCNEFQTSFLRISWEVIRVST